MEGRWFLSTHFFELALTLRTKINLLQNSPFLQFRQMALAVCIICHADWGADAVALARSRGAAKANRF